MKQWLTASIITLSVVCASAADAFANEDVCARRALDNNSGDLFSTTRRARRALEDRQILYGYFRRDLDQLAYAENLFALEDDSKLRVYGGPAARISLFPAVDACTTAGNARQGSYQNIRAGLLGGVTYRPWNLGLEVFSTWGGDTLQVSLPGELDTVDGPELSASASQQMIGGRLQITDWFALGAGLVQETFSKQELPDESLTLDEGASPARWMLWLEVPRLGLSTDVLFSSKDRALETFFIETQDIPLSPKFAVHGLAGYLRDESRGIAGLGVAYLPRNRFFEREDPAYRVEEDGAREDLGYDMISRGTAKTRVGLEASAETGSLGLRHVGLEVRQHRRQATSHEDNIARRVMRVPYVDMGASAELTLFHGQQMRDTTGVAWAPGAYAQGWFGAGFRMMSIHAAMGLGVNKPATLTRTSELVGSPELDISLNWRVGW